MTGAKPNKNAAGRKPYTTLTKPETPEAEPEKLETSLEPTESPSSAKVTYEPCAAASRRAGNRTETSAQLGSCGAPFENILGPLLVWLFKRSESPFTEAQAKEALNFQISITLYGLAAGFLVVVLVGVFLLPIIFFVQVVLTIIAAVRVSSGKAYTYPLTIRLIA